MKTQTYTAAAGESIYEAANAMTKLSRSERCHVQCVFNDTTLECGPETAPISVVRHYNSERMKLQMVLDDSCKRRNLAVERARYELESSWKAHLDHDQVLAFEMLHRATSMLLEVVK